MQTPFTSFSLTLLSAGLVYTLAVGNAADLAAQSGQASPTASTASPTAPPSGRFDMEVREDFFAGFGGNAERLARGMARTEEVLAAAPDHAEALVWHGSGLVFRSGQAFQSGDTATGHGALRSRSWRDEPGGGPGARSRRRPHSARRHAARVDALHAARRRPNRCCGWPWGITNASWICRRPSSAPSAATPRASCCSAWRTGMRASATAEGAPVLRAHDQGGRPVTAPRVRRRMAERRPRRRGSRRAARATRASEGFRL